MQCATKSHVLYVVHGALLPRASTSLAYETPMKRNSVRAQHRGHILAAAWFRLNVLGHDGRVGLHGSRPPLAAQWLPDRPAPAHPLARQLAANIGRPPAAR
mmetsp:Transcript_50021/g.112432  ORF Transcript_50021/g.112432 Transcript_50021/m.112432 type:complete len:101 (+) Transcript_50021:94-396(+)